MQSILASLSLTTAVSLLFICSLLYASIVVIYRLFFSPLAKFPGSRLAAATAWYEFYHDVIKPGMYIYEIQRMHEKHGPIVRVNPWELSIHDPDFYDELYVLGNIRKTDKYSKFCQGTGLDVRKMEPVFASLLRKFEENLSAAKGRVIRLDHALTCLSGDIIRSITCGKQEELLMDDPEWSHGWFDLFVTVVKSAPLMTSLPFLIHIALTLPTSWLLWLFPNGKAFQDFKNIARNHITEAKQEASEGKIVKAEEGRDTLFRQIADMDIPESEKDTERLTKEAQALFGAATVAVGRTMECIAYYLLADENMRHRLAAEIGTLSLDWETQSPKLSELEKLPYLQGIIQEGLRLSYGSMHRMPRLSPDEPIQYKEWTIPPNVPVGMSAYFNHTDPTIFQTPLAFVPDRWIGSTDPRMKKALTPFTRGSRMCLGNHLAISEINAFVARVFRPDGIAAKLELYETDESDVASVHDYMIPLPKLDSRGLRVRVTA